MMIALVKAFVLRRLVFEKIHFLVVVGGSSCTDFGKLVFCVKLVGVGKVLRSLCSIN